MSQNGKLVAEQENSIVTIIISDAPKKEEKAIQPTKNLGGRPSKKTPETIEKLLELTAKGKSVEQIADIIGVHSTTILNWMNDDKQFFWAVKEYRQYADSLVEKSLYEKAIGYKRKVEKPMMKNGEIEIAEYNEQLAPDTEAAKFWLKNRQPDKWKEKSEVDNNNKTLQITIHKKEEDL